jgi:hypothetical protein
VCGCIEPVNQKLAGSREPKKKNVQGGSRTLVSNSAPPKSCGYQSKFCLQRIQQRNQICCCLLRKCKG